MKSIIKFILILSLIFCCSTLLSNMIQNRLDCFSSLIDPEECYSKAKAFSDVGLTPNREYTGQGIKIGIIDDGVPNDLYNYNVGGLFGETSYNLHGHQVASIIGTNEGIAPDSTIYFASRKDNLFSFEECLRWLVEEQHVDVINHSMGFGNDYGYYNSQNSNFIDRYIKEKKAL